ncbi:DUF6559 family protein [Pedosphaera parvula]|uniref:Uncharacterized protein n=1 Tax=Pedosphaera parvula (strain Ellin514) TaxID=320771 RepID=B9XRK7_PEDPL|nr:DUF6559 family protein [Pedosphaera parvula]EEF57526.1 hypothetical protein Cflav_PD0535 [Pedosphaera parvula Ellin514]
MIRHVKKYFVIRSYVRRLSHELAGRFGLRSFYKVEHVTQAVQRGGFSASFIAYAHAAFCDREDFKAYYQPLGAAYSYQDLRGLIADRYLSGRRDFDARTIIHKFRRGDYSSGNFYESGIGTDGSDSGGN